MKAIPTVVALVVLAVILWVGWPTPYRYDHWRYDGDDYPVRISRFSGNAEILTGSGWHRLRPSRTPASIAPAPAMMDTGYSLDTTRR